MFSRRMVTRFTFMVLVVFSLTGTVGTAFAIDPMAAQTYYSKHAFTATPSSHPFLFADPAGPCYGKSSCYIDSYLHYYAPWGNYWAYGVDYGTQFINLYPNGSVITSWSRGNHSSLARWANGPCAGRGTNCVFTARRDYVNGSRQQREEVFAYNRFWIFDLTVSDGNRLLDSGTICDYGGHYGNLTLPDNLLSSYSSLCMASGSVGGVGGGGRARP